MLRGHCAAEGRDYDTHREDGASSIRPPLADVDAFLAEVAEYAALGVTEVQVMPDRHPVEFAHRIADEVLPKLTTIG